MVISAKEKIAISVLLWNILGSLFFVVDNFPSFLFEFLNTDIRIGKTSCKSEKLVRVLEGI